MQMTRIGSLAERFAATERARSIPEITAAPADLRFGKILNICYAQCLVWYVLTWSKHRHILQQVINYPFILEDIGPINLKSLKIALECHYSLHFCFIIFLMLNSVGCFDNESV
jgi:hypothetical protein